MSDARISISYMWVGLGAVLLLGSCSGDELASSERAQAAAETPAPGDDCREFAKHQHCALGKAKLSGDDKLLDVSEARSVDSDGVAIFLPEVSRFAPRGMIKSENGDVTVLAKAYSDGHVISTMLTEKKGELVTFNPTFTAGGGDDGGGGGGGGSEYRVKVIDGGLEATLAPWELQQVSIYCPELHPYYPTCMPPEVFNNNRATGTCGWEIEAPHGADMNVALLDGTVLKAQRIIFEEVLKDGGSYPYMSFQRIDYTVSGGGLILEGEDVE